MPKLKIVCSDKPKLKQGEVRNKYPGDCFRKGLRAGFVAGLNKQLKKQVRIKPILQELKNPPKLRTASLATLIQNRPNKTTTKIRDFLTTLPIKNKEYQMSTRKKKALSTDGLKTYLVATGEYTR
ncbi:MAG: hypothetical protein RLZZ418_591 [Pseudomonadota bacterium]|jgi:hypothetical protein